MDVQEQPSRALRWGLRGLAAVVVGTLCVLGFDAMYAKEPDPRIPALAAEVRSKGWIVYSARSEAGDWDLFLIRPDGSSRQNITNTPDHGEAAPRFSPNGRRLLYRRLVADRNSVSLPLSERVGSAARLNGVRPATFRN